jgi:hypothetical protein
MWHMQPDNSVPVTLPQAHLQKLKRRVHPNNGQSSTQDRSRVGLWKRNDGPSGKFAEGPESVANCRLFHNSP